MRIAKSEDQRHPSPSGICAWLGSRLQTSCWHESQLMENQPPVFWTDSLSRIFRDATPVAAKRGARPSHTERADAPGRRTTAAPRRGQKTPSEDKKVGAKRLRAARYTYSEIGRMLVVGKSQAYRLVDGA